VPGKRACDGQGHSQRPKHLKLPTPHFSAEHLMPTNLKLRACRVAMSNGAHWPRVFAHAAFKFPVFEVSPGRSAGHRRPVALASSCNWHRPKPRTMRITGQPELGHLRGTGRGLQQMTGPGGQAALRVGTPWDGRGPAGRLRSFLVGRVRRSAAAASSAKFPSRCSAYPKLIPTTLADQPAQRPPGRPGRTGRQTI
jgi:hypothetical protein